MSRELQSLKDEAIRMYRLLTEIVSVVGTLRLLLESLLDKRGSEITEKEYLAIRVLLKLIS